jgi:hypothetical protein
MPKGRNSGAAAKRQPRPFAIGDHVRIMDISADLKAQNHDLKNAEYQDMRTAELFRFCVGRVFTVYGFDRYGNVELHVGNSSAVRERFGKWHTIWSEPEFLKLVSKRKMAAKRSRRTHRRV